MVVADCYEPDRKARQTRKSYRYHSWDVLHMIIDVVIPREYPGLFLQAEVNN